MCSSTAPCEIGWAEELPEHCPPADALPLAGLTYYRMVDSIPPTPHDFDSYRQLSPRRKSPVCECRTRAVSIFTSANSCLSLLKLPRFRGKRVVRISIPLNAGAIKRTGSPGHMSWWRCATFDPVGASVSVD